MRTGTTNRPTRLRIFKVTGDEYPWYIDGTDNEGNFTDDVRQFATHAECLLYADLFVADATYDGVRWEWDVDRPKSARYVKAVQP
jgi:hypothetical protein